MLELDAANLAAAGAVAFVAAFVQGVTGFGSAIVAMPLLSLLVDVRASAPLVALLSLAINTALLVPERRRLPWGRVGPLLAGSLAGVPCGVLFVAGADERLARGALGAALVVSSLCLLRFGRLPLGTGKWPAAAFGAFSGLLGGAFNASGPPAVLYAASQSWDKAETRAALQLYFLLSGLVVVALHAFSGLTDRSVLLTAAAALPLLAAGSFAGHAVHRRVSEERFRTLVRVLLLAAGIALIATR